MAILFYLIHAAGIAVLLAAWFMYQGVDVYLQNKTERDILKARDSAVAAIGPKSAAFSEQMMAAHKISVPTMSDEGLKLTFRNAVKDAEAVEVFSADLNVPYGDPIAFGVGKLAADVREPRFLEAGPKIDDRVLRFGRNLPLHHTIADPLVPDQGIPRARACEAGTSAQESLTRINR